MSRIYTEPLENLVGHDQPVDLVGAFVDLGALRVAHQALDAGLARVPTRPEQLDRVGRDPHRGVGGGPLRDRRQPRRSARRGPWRAAASRVDRPRRGDLAGHLGEHEPEPLLLDQRRPERLALLEIAARGLQPGPRDADARRRDRDPALAERRQRDLVALALAAEPVRDRHLGAIEDQLRRRTGPDPHLPLVRPEPETRRVPFSTRNAVIAFAPALGSSVANTRYRSASGAFEIQIFVPVNR